MRLTLVDGHTAASDGATFHWVRDMGPVSSGCDLIA